MKLQGKIVTEYLDRFPDVQSKTIARKIYEENKSVFNSLENVRNTVRYYRGKIGTDNKKVLSTDKYLKDSDYSSWNKIPEGEKELDWDRPKILNFNSVLVLADIHVPYHSKEALISALEYGQKKNVDCIYLNGDFFDFYPMSRFVKDPRRRSFAEEIKTGKLILQLIADNFPNAKKYFKIGNHDFRYELYMILKAPELLDVAEFSFDKIIGLTKMGYEIVGNKEFSIINNLPVLHGHEAGQSFTNPVNAARGAFLKMLDTCMISHYHQPSSHSESRSLTFDDITCWSTGCLCDLHPAYAPVNKWSHGFAIIHKDGENGFNVENKKITKNGKIRNV